MVDMVLVGSLIIMVMFSGYENFVSALDVGRGHRKAELARQARRQLAQAQGGVVHRRDLIDSSVARLHDDAGRASTNGASENPLMWYVIIHLTFVVSAVMMGVLDRMTAKSHGHDDHKGEV